MTPTLQLGPVIFRHSPVAARRETTSLADLEASIIATIYAPVDPAEPLAHAASRRERDLATILARFDLWQARHLARRLDLARHDDPLVTAFTRLAPVRRVRLRRLLDERPQTVHAKAA